MKLEVIIEKSKTALFGRIEGSKGFLPVTAGESLEEVLSNLKDLIRDHLAHDAVDAFWHKIKPNKLSFKVTYDVQAFFIDFSYISRDEISKRTGISKELIVQYAKGKAFPPLSHVKKIERAIHKLAAELKTVSLC